MEKLCCLICQASELQASCCSRSQSPTLCEASIFDRSIDARGFYAQVFVLPLCVPTKHIGFNFGWRVGGGSRLWNADAPNLIAELGRALKREALPFLSRVQSQRDVAEAGMSLQKSADRHVQQAIAYTLARAGDVGKAVAALDDLTRLLDVKVPWQLEMFERANALKSQLLTDAPNAQKQLEAWETESVRNLGLEKFRRTRPAILTEV